MRPHGESSLAALASSPAPAPPAGLEGLTPAGWGDTTGRVLAGALCAAETSRIPRVSDGLGESPHPLHRGTRRADAGGVLRHDREGAVRHAVRRLLAKRHPAFGAGRTASRQAAPAPR